MRIKDVLKEKGITQQMLADKMNVSLSAVKQMVSANSLTTTTLEKIATALEIPIWQLFVSPSDVAFNGTTIKCPNCGTEFEVELKLKENIK